MKSPRPSTIKGQIPLLLCPHVRDLFPRPRLDTAAPIRPAVSSFEAASPDGGSVGQRPHLLHSLSFLFPSLPRSFPIPCPPLLVTPSILREGFPGSLVVKNLPAMQETQVRYRVGKIPWRREWQSTPVFLPGEFHGPRSLVGHSPWGCKQSDTTERLHNPSTTFN